MVSSGTKSPDGSEWLISADMTPFKLVFSVEMNHLKYQSIKEAIEHQYVKYHEENQEENRW